MSSKDGKTIDKMITSLTPKARRSLLLSLLTSLEGEDVEYAAELITKKKKQTKNRKATVKDDSDSSDTSSSENEDDSNESKTNGISISDANGENACYPMDPPSSPIVSIPILKPISVKKTLISDKKVSKASKLSVEEEPSKSSLTTDEESEGSENLVPIIPRTNFRSSIIINDSSIDDSTEEDETKKAINGRVILYNSTKNYSSNTHTQSSVSRPHVQEKRDRISSKAKPISTDDDSPPSSKLTSNDSRDSHSSNQPDKQSSTMEVEEPDSIDSSKRRSDPSYEIVDSDPQPSEENLSNSAMEIHQEQSMEDQKMEDNEENLNGSVPVDNSASEEFLLSAHMLNKVSPNDASSIVDIDNSENDTIGPANSDNESVLTLGTDSLSEPASSFTDSDASENIRHSKKKSVNKSKKMINKKVKSDQSNSNKPTAVSEAQPVGAEENSCSTTTTDTTHTNSVTSFVINDTCLSSVASVHIVRLPQELVESTASAKSIQRRVRQMETDVFKDLHLRWCKQASRPVNRSKMTPSRKVTDSDSDNYSDDEAWIPNKASTSKGIKKTRSNSNRYNWTVIESSDSNDDKPIQRARRTRRTRGLNDQEAGPSEEKRSNTTGALRKKRNRVISSEEESQISTDNEIVKSDPDDDEILDDTDEDNKLLKKDAPKPKSKRRRVVTLSSDDDGKSDKKRGKGRKNIKKMLTEKELKEETRAAGQREKERIQRIAERQKLYNEVLLDEMKLDPEKPSRLILEIDPDTREPIVEVAPELAKQMKAHQVKGIRFMWDSVIESVLKAKEDGSGCILAHSMGLGKTFQIICFLHTLLTHRQIKKHIKHALVICPVNTIKNWISEFRQWLEDDGLLEFPLFDLSDSKSQLQRGDTFKLWRQRGGVLICGITLFAQLVSPKGKKPKCPKWVRDIITEALVEPGPDIVVIDEGHVLKNSQTAVNKAVNSISTLRRIILTGTPLQNNLDEYHVMVHFVKPNLLGTKKEFTNRFVSPITNGQHIDSTPGDVVVMKKRVHVLHKLLDGCVQRFDYGVLKPYLQPKLEFIVSIKLTEKQIELYRYYLDNMSAREGSALLADFANLRLIWNHPALLYSAHTKRREAEAKRNEKDFVTTEEEESMSESDSDCNIIESDKEGKSKKSAKNGLESNSNSNSNSNGAGEADGASDNEVSKKWTSRTRSAKSEVKNEEPQLPDNDPETEFKDCWFYNLLPFMEMDKLEWSSKMTVLFYILDECEKIGDKVIVFTQSLDTLDFIETCLETRAQAMEASGNSYSWRHGLDYFRIDGSVSGGLRKSHIDIFNNPNNLRARLFLLSTKAGGLGINLVGANRCIIFDASWNPTHDIQAIFRIYRFGQTKPVFIYRFIAQGTMEEKIYERQVYKQSLSVRVIDELQVGRHFRAQDLQELYKFEPDMREERPILNVPKDRLLADLIVNHKDLIVKYHEHDSLLENRPEEDLTEDERKSAWQEYEQEKEAQVERERIAEELAKQREAAYRQFQQNMQNQQQDANQGANQIPNTNSEFFNAYNFGNQNAYYVYLKQAQAQAQANAQAQYQAQQQAQQQAKTQASAQASAFLAAAAAAQAAKAQAQAQAQAQARAQAQAQSQAQAQAQFRAQAAAAAAKAQAQAQKQRTPPNQNQQMPKQQSEPHQNNTTVKGLPNYDVLTVEDCLRYVDNVVVDDAQKFQQLFRILSNGLSVALQSLNKLKEIKKTRYLTAEEQDQELKHKKELENLQRQVARAREMAKIRQKADDEPIKASSFNKPVAEIIEEPD